MENVNQMISDRHSRLGEFFRFYTIRNKYQISIFSTCLQKFNLFLSPVSHLALICSSGKSPVVNCHLLPLQPRAILSSGKISHQEVHKLSCSKV
ncbi:hypothetical protein CRE_02973 [Caenorhabditis remanei]|uniref:Uncharacterized protein n=1 Tax=Caenorhabditis remanei TaxID=31234 RepID=E3LX02_CAERE|nr:hypothetical protein CRE_02973 [Caenorhabditis remanei]